MLKIFIKLFVYFSMLTFALFSSEKACADEIDEQLNNLEQSLLQNVVHSNVQLDELLAISSQLNNYQKVKLYTLKSISHILAGQYKKAITLLDKALLLEPNDEQLTKIYSYKITASIPLKRYGDAFSLLEKSLARVETFEDDGIKISAYVRLMNTYLDLEAYDEVIRLSEVIFNLNNGKDVQSQCYTMLLLAAAQSSLNTESYTKKLQLFDNAQVYCALNNLPLIKVMSIKGKGEVEFEFGRYQSAEAYFISALEGYQPFNFELEINNIHALLSEVYFHLQDYQQAILYADLVNELPNEPDNYEAKKQAYNVLSMIASKRGQFKEAYQYQVLAHAISVQLINDKKVRETAYQMAKFDSAEKTRELNKLVQDHQMVAKQRSIMNNEKSSSYMFSTVLSGTVAFLSLLLATAWMQRNQFRKQAQLDSLTGLLNRGTGQEQAENEFIQVQARGGEYCVLVMDLDLFKNINDSYGHATGDWVLKKIAEILTASLRDTDIACRMGGEEFAIFMPFTSKLLAIELAEKVRFEIEAINTRFSGHQFTVTASFGISELTEDDLSLDPLLNRADVELYKAKSQGRNKVCF